MMGGQTELGDQKTHSHCIEAFHGSRMPAGLGWGVTSELRYYLRESEVSWDVWTLCYRALVGTSNKEVDTRLDTLALPKRK